MKIWKDSHYEQGAEHLRQMGYSMLGDKGGLSLWDKGDRMVILAKQANDQAAFFVLAGGSEAWELALESVRLYTEGAGA